MAAATVPLFSQLTLFVCLPKLGCGISTMVPVEDGGSCHVWVKMLNTLQALAIFAITELRKAARFDPMSDLKEKESADQHLTPPWIDSFWRECLPPWPLRNHPQGHGSQLCFSVSQILVFA